MTSFIGIPGALIEIACPSSEDMSPDQSISELVPFSGARLLQVGPGVRRSWSIEHSLAYPREMAVLDALAYGHQGSLSWVGAQAQVTNLLTPGQSALTEVMLAGGAQAFTGAIQCGDVWAARWAGGPVGNTVRIGFDKPTPVIAGRAVTMRAWVEPVSGSTPVTLARYWLDSTGASISAVTHTRATAGWLSVTATPPAGAVALRMEWRDAGVVTMPQVVWGSSISEYMPGRGVYRVHLSAATDALIAAHSRLTASAVGFTLREVG